MNPINMQTSKKRIKQILVAKICISEDCQGKAGRIVGNGGHIAWFAK